MDDKIKPQVKLNYNMKATLPSMHCIVPLAALHDGNFLWKNSWKKHLQMYLLLHYYFYVNSATFESTAYLGSLFLHPFC